MDRASRYLVESAPDLAFADSLAQAGSQGLRDQLAVSSFNNQVAQQSLVNDRIARQQALENARYEAKDALERQAQQDEVAALKYISNFRANKPNSDVELDAILAQHPAALRSPAVRELFSRKAQEAEINKQFAEKYATSTGGEPLPTSEDGHYDMPRAQLRLFRAEKLTDATARGILTPEDANKWRGMDEFQFKPVWEEYVSGLQGAKATADAAQKRLDDKRKVASDTLESVIKSRNALKQQPGEIVAPNEKLDDLRKANDADLITAVNTQRDLAGKTISLTPPDPNKQAEALVTAGKSVADQLRAGQALNPTKK